MPPSWIRVANNWQWIAQHNEGMAAHYRLRMMINSASSPREIPTFLFKEAVAARLNIPTVGGTEAHQYEFIMVRGQTRFIWYKRAPGGMIVYNDFVGYPIDAYKLPSGIVLCYS